jgi:hypothetical protein
MHKLRDALRALHPLCPWLLSALPLAHLVATVARSAVECPFWDQWDLIPLLERAINGTLSWRDLWMPHNEHRILFPHAMMIALGYWTHWTVLYEIALNLLLGFCIFVVLARLMRNTLTRIGQEVPWWLTPLIALLVFSLTQWENWLWGWQIQIFLNVLAVAGGVAWLVASSGMRAWLLAAGAGVVATFSFGTGLLFWPIGFALLCMQRPCPPHRAIRLTIWALIGILTIGAYMHGLRLESSGLGYLLTHPAQYAQYVGLFLGAPVVVSIPVYKSVIVWTAGMGGLLLLALLCMRLHRQGILAGLAAPMALSGYAVLSGCVAGLQRLHLGAMQALSPRYTTYATLLWLGLVVMMAVCLQREGKSPDKASRRRVWAFRFLLVSIAVLVSVCTTVGTRRSIDRHVHRLVEARQALLAGRTGDEVLEKIYPDPAYVRKYLKVLQAYKLSLFQE